MRRDKRRSEERERDSTARLSKEINEAAIVTRY